MARYMRERGFDDLRRAVALVGRGPRGLLGLDLGPLRRRRARRHGARRRARCRARSGSRARRSTTPSTRSAASADDALGDRRRRRGLRERRRVDVGRAARADARGSRPACARSASSAATASPPTCRTSPRRSAAFLAARLARRGVVELLARLRRAQRDRPLRADRAEGAAGGRRLPLQRRASSTAARRVRRRSPRRGRRPSSCARLPRRHGLGATGCRGDEPLEFERVPFDHPLWVLYSSRHHRAAEGDRPGPGRDPARAPQDAAPARRRAGRRPALLVHDDRLDDVELPRLRAADRGDRSLLYDGSPGHPDMDVLWDFAARTGDDDVRHERAPTSARA